MSRPSSEPLTCHGTPGVTSTRGTAHASRSRASRVARAEAEIVPARDVVGEQHRAVGIADVGGVGDRQQRVGEHACRTARSAAPATRAARLTSLLRTSLASSSITLRSASRAFGAARDAGRRRSRRRRGRSRRGRSVGDRGQLRRRSASTSASVIFSAASARAAAARSSAASSGAPSCFSRTMLQTLALGGAEIETIRLPLPRDRPRDRAVARRRSRHRREHRRFAGVGARDRGGQTAAHPARDRAGIAAVLGQRQRDELLDQRLRLAPRRASSPRHRARASASAP